MDPLAISLLVRWLQGWFFCWRFPWLPQHYVVPDLASELGLRVLANVNLERGTIAGKVRPTPTHC
ncbi:MAG: hypothetical protein WCO50_02485 [Synechococcus sp. ELA619]